MVRLLSTLGFFAGFGLLGLALLNPPSMGSLQAREQSAMDCRMTDVPVDEGYGVTATETRLVCSR